MKKISGILVLVVLMACSANKFDLQLVTNITPPMEQGLAFAIVDFNPTVKFIREFDTLNQKAAPDSATDKNVKLINSLITSWDALFNKLPANDNFLMNSVDSLNYTKTGGIFVPLSTTWWVISKSFLIDGQPYCYVVQLAVKKGAIVSCKPDKSNLVLLTEVYKNQILKKS